MSCGCKDTDHGFDCPFQDTFVYEGQYFPKKQHHKLLLTTTAGQREQPVRILTDVVVTMYVTVLDGVLEAWDNDIASNATSATGGDQPHMRFTSSDGVREIVLPPGEHRWCFGQGNSAACTASVYIIDREAR